MKTLIIHPTDPTTEFLRIIYEGLGFNVINEPVSESKLSGEICANDRIILLGHGSSWGLMGWGDIVFYDDLVECLPNSPNNIFIWCHADVFVARHGLPGLHCGMFISEVGEAIAHGISVSQEQIDHSNERFALAMRAVIQGGQPRLGFDRVIQEYSSEICPVIQFNRERLYFSCCKEKELFSDTEYLNFKYNYIC